MIAARRRRLAVAIDNWKRSPHKKQAEHIDGAQAQPGERGGS